MSFVNDHISSCTHLAMEHLKEKNPEAAILSAEAANHALTGYAHVNGKVLAAYDGVRLTQMGASEEQLAQLENVVIAYPAVLPAAAVNLAMYAHLEKSPREPGVAPLSAEPTVRDRMEFQKCLAEAYLGLLQACMESRLDIVGVLAEYLSNTVAPLMASEASKADEGEASNE